MVYFESSDLESWSGPRKSSIQERGHYYQRPNGEVLFYREKLKSESGDQIKFFDVSDDLTKLTFKGSYD